MAPHMWAVAVQGVQESDRTPDLPALEAFRPAVAALPSARVPLTKTAPATA
ncbi:hypothetical protein ACFYO0_39565 [Streptomyces sp. NPDC006365]|uniref:hypothetical protein n=1 Tax=Streptomyces sp. NPDC006365 TaxID=3364744 RepID=UPI0036CEE77A